jgi:hypothetical protein
MDDAADDKVFMLGDRKVLNVYGLLFELKHMSDKTYKNYVGNDFNYFADWIDNVLNQTALADNLRKVQEKGEAITILENQVKNQRYDARDILRTLKKNGSPVPPLPPSNLRVGKKSFIEKIFERFK